MRSRRSLNFVQFPRKKREERREIRVTEHFTYTLIQSERRTLSLRVEEDGSLTVRAPYGERSRREADNLVEENRGWVMKRFAEIREIQSRKRVYTESERAAGKLAAKEIFTGKCRKYAEILDVTYGRITIREQKSRWGSCSRKGNLNFNWKLALMPEEIQDYVAVHELAHRLQMNHSRAFWEIVESILPDYRERREWLRKNGAYY